MPGLVDLVLPKRSVEIYGTEITVTGVDVDYLGTLWDRFPQLSDMAAAGDYSPKAILALGPEVSAAFIAAGTGAGGSVKAEGIARALPLGYKLELIAEILEMSMPRGPGPFVDAFVRILSACGITFQTPELAGGVGSSGNSPTE